MPRSKKVSSIDTKSVKTNVLDVRGDFQRVQSLTNAGAIGADVDLTDPEDIVDIYYATGTSTPYNVDLPTAADLYNFLLVRGRYAVGASVQFVLANGSTTGAALTLVPGTGGTAIGNIVLHGYNALQENFPAGTVILRMTSPTAYQVILG